MREKHKGKIKSTSALCETKAKQKKLTQLLIILDSQ
jgi:hypothetical protein